MFQINELSATFNEWLEQITEKALITDTDQINEQQLRQIILRATLIDYMRSAIAETTSSRVKSSD